MFKLFVTSTDVDSGAIPISWCVSKEKLEELAKRGIKDPQIVLCVVPEANYFPSKEYRKVVPLKDLMTYVEFRHPGKNKIYGIISFKGKRSAENCYLSKTFRTHDTTMLTYNGDDWREGWEDITHKDVVSVDVPAGCFAPEPPDWEKAWVNHHFSSRCVDQCQYRRRRIFAYTVQPILMFLNLLLRMWVLIMALSVGMRGVRFWKQVFLPLTYGIKDIFENMFDGGSVFIRPTKTEAPWEFYKAGWWLIKRCWTLVFTPLLLFPLLAMFWIFGIKATLIGWALVFLMIVGILVGVVITASIISLIINRSTRDRVFNWLFSPFRSKDLWYTNDDEMINIICDGTIKPMKVSRLPRKHRTIRLRLSELKSKVCKPFSR
jgi:hypothetical protein